MTLLRVKLTDLLCHTGVLQVPQNISDTHHYIEVTEGTSCAARPCCFMCE